MRTEKACVLFLHVSECKVHLSLLRCSSEKGFVSGGGYIVRGHEMYCGVKCAATQNWDARHGRGGGGFRKVTDISMLFEPRHHIKVPRSCLYDTQVVCSYLTLSSCFVCFVPLQVTRSPVHTHVQVSFKISRTFIHWGESAVSAFHCRVRDAL